ncbi:MAG: RNA polymerase sigma-54 factor, partial [Cyclobacteriaceae bacterium]|nr:RNA polymerase sigma-54 factor [Cyclobacteriaceae bacterium]
MQKLGLSQNLQQKLSPQQIQFIKLLQVPTAELESRIEEELEINPALEEGEEQEKIEDENSPDEEPAETSNSEEDIDIKDYLSEDDYGGYKMQGDGNEDEDDREMPIPMSSSLHEQLMSQLDFLGLPEREYAVGKQLVGSIESDGY